MLVSEAGVEIDSERDKHKIYTPRHTYVTFQLQDGVYHYLLARNMETSVKMLGQHYGHTNNQAIAEQLTKYREKKRKKLAWK